MWHGERALAGLFPKRKAAKSLPLAAVTSPRGRWAPAPANQTARKQLTEEQCVCHSTAITCCPGEWVVGLDYPSRGPSSSPWGILSASYFPLQPCIPLTGTHACCSYRVKQNLFSSFPRSFLIIRTSDLPIQVFLEPPAFL